MATTTFLSNATVNITGSGSAIDLSSQCQSAVLQVGYDSLEITSLADTAHKFQKGLQNVTVTLNLYNSYGAGQVEATLYDCLNNGSCTIVISPSGTTESASNPEYTITGAFLESFTPINSTTSEISMSEAVFTGGTFARDITAP